MNSFSSGKSSGYTLLEVLIVVAIVALLIGISFPAYNKWREGANSAVCRSKMRTIHGAFSAAIADNGEWPQIPTKENGDLPDWDQAEFFQFWQRTMEPYGIAKDTWICPSDTDANLQFKVKDPELTGSYIPAWFGPGAATPFKWKQPWLIERAGFHGKGHLVAMPDGSIQEFSNPFAR